MMKEPALLKSMVWRNTSEGGRLKTDGTALSKEDLSQRTQRPQGKKSLRKKGDALKILKKSEFGMRKGEVRRDSGGRLKVEGGMRKAVIC
jgi:hypothetical protein